MLKAILFDFDGVLADTEPLHFRAFQKVLSEEGVPLTEHDYYARYVGFDDKGCFEGVLSDRGRPTSAETIGRLMQRKASLLLEQLRTDLIIFPGIVPFVHAAAQHYRLSIVSGALRHEIEFSLDTAGLRDHFEHITAAEDIRRGGKPDPEGYLHALQELSRKAPLEAADCLVIEDSIPGIEAAHAAGMRCLAVSNTFPAQELGLADAVTSTLQNYDLASLERRFWR